MLFAVAVIAVAATAIGPMFLQSADTSVLTSTAAAASVGRSDVLVIANGGVARMDQVSASATAVERLAHGLVSPAILSVDTGGNFYFKKQGYQTDVLARSGACRHLRFVKGGCPTGTYDVAISERSAVASHVGVGTRLDITAPHSAKSIEVTVSGIYLPPSTVDDAYWRNNDYFVFGEKTATEVTLDPLFASMTTALDMHAIALPQLSADFAWRNEATRIGASALDSTSHKIKSLLFSRYDLTSSTGLPSVLSTAAHDDNLMSAVVLAIVLQLILLSLLILYSLGKSTLDSRRQESEFARRHGFPRSALIALAIGEPTVLIVAAFPAGLVVAWGTLVIFTRTLFVSGTPVSLPATAIGAAAGVCLAGVVAMTIASSDLWRVRTTDRVRENRATVAVDVFALALTIAGLALLLTKSSLSASKADSLTLLAPGMLTLGAALLGLRLAALVIKMFVARTVDSPRVGWFLALRQVGRRPSTLRRILPLTVATAVLLFALSNFFVASSNRSLLADVEVGAARVVDVTPPSGLNFQAAVRRADPSGREAMAVIDYSSPTGEMLAVDSSRLAAVANWPTAQSHPSLAALARTLSPRLPKGVVFSGSELRLSLDVAKGTPSIYLGVSLFDATYDTSRTLYAGPLAAGRHSYIFNLGHACPGVCRLTSLAPNWFNTENTYTKNVRFALTGVAVRDGEQWRQVDFGSTQKGAWNTQPSSVHVEPPGRCCSVVFDIPGGDLPYQGLLLSPVDLPPELPAIVTTGALRADAPPSASREGNLDIDLGGELLGVHPLVVVPTLPFIGESGSLVDLNLAQRAATSSDDVRTYQVWLTPSASPSILRRLRGDGVALRSTTSVAARLGVLDHAGVALAYAVALVVTPIAALLAIGTVAFAIISDGRRRRREIASLSMAGVPMRTLRRAQALEGALVLGIALVVGTIIGLIADSLALSSLPQFVSGTSGVPISHSVPFVPFLCAVGAFGLLLALALELSTRLVLRNRASHHVGGLVE